MNIAIILAGGKGLRMNSSIPKQFIKVNEKPIISYTLKAFENSNLIDKIIVVCLDEYKKTIKNIIFEYNIKKCHKIVKNGDNRQLSVFNALEEIKTFADNNDIIIIHDGVRAMISSDLIDKCIKETKKYNSTTLAEKTKNTIILSNNNLIDSFIDRDYVYNVQTPQSFKFSIIYDSHIKYMKNKSYNATDDTMLVIKNNYKVHIIENNMPNFKLTTSEDLKIFEYILNKK